MKLYRVLTENKNYQDIIAQLQLRAIDATVIKTNGLWKGKAEKSIVIEIVFNDNYHLDNGETVEGFVYWLKKHNKQDRVLVEIIDTDILYL